jgi:hypothetical protein
VHTCNILPKSGAEARAAAAEAKAANSAQWLLFVIFVLGFGCGITGGISRAMSY